MPRLEIQDGAQQFLQPDSAQLSVPVWISWIFLVWIDQVKNMTPRSNFAPRNQGTGIEVEIPKYAFLPPHVGIQPRDARPFVICDFRFDRMAHDFIGSGIDFCLPRGHGIVFGAITVGSDHRKKVP